MYLGKYRLETGRWRPAVNRPMMTGWKLAGDDRLETGRYLSV